MGLLDDAIREHLELKRRRGASSSEIARQEQEAFGPARRGDLLLDDEPPAALDEPAAFADEAPTELHAAPELRVVEEPEPLDPEPAAADEPAAEPEPEAGEPSRIDPELEIRDEFSTPLEVQDEPPRPHGDPADALPHAQPTREFDAEELRAATEAEPQEPEAAVPPPAAEEPAAAPPAPRAAEEDDGEGADGDVLEETPEFLQETPEHDRLWFEQRPPRDFDF